MPTLDPAAGGRKVGRMVSRDGDLNPVWPVLWEIALANPEPIFEELCAATGYEMPRKRSELADVMAQLLAVGQACDENSAAIARLTEDVMKSDVMRKVRRAQSEREDVA